MIDQEYYREQHHQDFEREWMQENKKVLTYHMQRDVVDLRSKFDDEEDFRAKAKDRILAKRDPQLYCLDRCLATGNCDIFEEL
jgi:hypothetical protein